MTDDKPGPVQDALVELNRRVGIYRGLCSIAAVVAAMVIVVVLPEPAHNAAVSVGRTMIALGFAVVLRVLLGRTFVIPWAMKRLEEIERGKRP